MQNPQDGNGEIEEPTMSDKPASPAQISDERKNCKHIVMTNFCVACGAGPLEPVEAPKHTINAQGICEQCEPEIAAKCEPVEVVSTAPKEICDKCGASIYFSEGSQRWTLNDGSGRNICPVVKGIAPKHSPKVSGNPWDSERITGYKSKVSTPLPQQAKGEAVKPARGN